jgi:hypothetical protein
MVSGELVALLVTDTLPAMLPAEAGLNVAVKLAVCPGVKMSPVETPLALKPAPEMLTPEIVTFEFPLLVNVTIWLPVLDRFTLPKLKLEALEFSTSVAAFTVSAGELLVALPALFVTVTEN